MHSKSCPACCHMRKNKMSTNGDLPPDYLGDSVYISDDGTGLVLTLERHDNPDHRIYMEQYVIMALKRYIARWEAHHGHTI